MSTETALSAYNSHITTTCNQVALPGENYDLIAMRHTAASFTLFFTLLSLTVFASIVCGTALARNNVN
jgi:hypothetical protein